MAATGRLMNGNFNFPTVKFLKTGSEINNAIDARLKQFGDISEKAKAVIAGLCKEVGLELSEVLVDADDHVGVSSYENKVFANNKSTHHSVITALQEKLATIRLEASHITQAQYACDNLARVKKNIENTRTFDLTYAELTEFGF